MTSVIFGGSQEWPPYDLIGLSREFSLPMVIDGYRNGVFPMPITVGDAGEMGWFSPLRRGILPLDGLRVTRSLRKMTGRYRVSVDTAFDEVMVRCADPRREGGWIDDRILAAYQALHRRGLAHSVECRDDDGRLVGGLYGVAIGGLFAGESMFHDPEHGRDASKVALVELVRRLNAQPGERLLDVQWRTDHLATLGVIEIDRDDYLGRLARAVTTPALDWTG